MLYLAVLLNVFSRRIVGWAMAHHLRTELVLGALEMALAQRRPDSVIHHPERACQYTSIDFGGRCRASGIRPPMGNVGDCYKNAMCESFFATLESNCSSAADSRREAWHGRRFSRISRADTTRAAGIRA